MSDVTGIKLVVDKSPEESISLSNRAVVGTTQSGFSSRYIDSGSKAHFDNVTQSK